MAQPEHQFLRLVIGGSAFLLPSLMRYTIEQREALADNSAARSPVAAWRTVRGTRWPAYSLGSDLMARAPGDWHRAVFLEARPQNVGIIVDEVQMLPRGETAVANFTPLGPAPTRFGHLFNGAWVSGREVTLVFEPTALIGYLQSLGE